jgi:cytosine/uracil/thiamine/allantoin permease
VDDAHRPDVCDQQHGHPHHVRRPGSRLLQALTGARVSRNAPDFASRASHPQAALWPQLIAMPLGFSLVSFIGIIVSSSSTVIYGEPVWNPITLLGMFLDHSPSHATRFGVRSPSID